jgi:hypothetical protein
MYCNPIGQSYNPENEITKLFDLSPESYSTIALNFNADRILNYPNTPFFLEIRAFPQNFILEISCKFIRCHALSFIMLSRYAARNMCEKPNARINRAAIN